MKYTVFLNGEAYVSTDDYQKAEEVMVGLYQAADEEEDFQNYYGSFPVVEIIEED